MTADIATTHPPPPEHRFAASATAVPLHPGGIAPTTSRIATNSVTVDTGVRVTIIALSATVFATARGLPMTVTRNLRDIPCGSPISLYTVINTMMPSMNVNVQETGSDGIIM